uniref:Leucine-rich repeat and coiled-coil domain-containing protein 1 n=1 Tax=Mola mola TaxID=94237 RepID=A0A3Q3XJS5_MOLML
MGNKELSLIEKNLTSLLDVPLTPTVTSLNLHGNQIPRIEGLTSTWHLRHLDLSSNCISHIEGLSSLTSLRTLNLSCNLITKVEGLNGLVRLTRLNLSHNQINNLAGFLCLHGREYNLEHISLQGNNLDRVDHLLQCLLGLQGLREVTLSQHDSDNPICRLPDYWDSVMESLPQISVLDDLDRLGNQSRLGLVSPFDFPGLDDYLDLLLSSDTSHKEAVMFDSIMSPIFMQVPADDKSSSSTPTVVAVRKAKRHIDRTLGSECDSSTENQRRPRVPRHRKSVMLKISPKESRSWRSDRYFSTQLARSQKDVYTPASGARGTDVAEPTTVPLRAVDVKTKSTEDEETYRRERRWKAEQAVRKLTEDLTCLQTKVGEEKDLQSMALHTTDRLKELLLKERSGRSELQTRIEELEGRCQSLTQKLEQARGSEEQHKTKLHRLEESISQAEAVRTRQQAEEMKRFQEVENKAAALKRELDIQRVSVRQHKDKLQQLHELLASREQEHRKQLDVRLQPGGADFREAVAKEVASVEQRHGQREAGLQEKVAEGRRQYAALEDEFRMALTIEAARFSEVKEACDQMTAELLGLKATLAQSQQREKKSSSLVQELTAIVKEQKSRISDLIKAKRDAVNDLKSRLHSMEAEVEQDRRLSLQIELLKKEKARLLSQLTAQESVIDGLRAERRIWGQELAQQGASLAQDRGRLEVRIEVLSAELENQKKQNERDNDALKIKAKIVDDQTETIRRLKEALLERDDKIRKMHEEATQAQKKLQQQLDQETAHQVEMREQLERLRMRKEELKQQLEDKEEELEEVKRVHSNSSKKWQEKAELLTLLESQVKRMKENFDAKEHLLLEERHKATEAHKAAVEKLRSVDDSFRQQLESVQAAHQAELMGLANEKQKQIEQANQKVYEVEGEMRQLLEETETNKKIMEEKMKFLTSVLKDF